MNMADNRGFMMAELIIVSAIVLIVLANFCTSYMKLYSKYQERVSYYDVSSLFRLAYYRDYLIEMPNSSENNNLMNEIIQEVKDKKIIEIYGFENSIIKDYAIEQIDGYKDKVLLLYDNKSNLNSTNIENFLKSNGQGDINNTFKNYIDYLKDSTEFKSDYIFITERCEINNIDNCKYAYLDVYDADVIENNSCGKSVELFSIIKENAKSDNGINFGQISSDTNGNGLYIRNGTQSNTYPIYYYRGAVDNNNVIFANFCWKIVRTTDTGGIKLIYNGYPSGSKCNNTGLSTMLNNMSVFESIDYGYATIKTNIDAWYEANMVSYTSYLEDTVWCNDKDNSANTFGAYRRLAVNKTPSLKCTLDDDR